MPSFARGGSTNRHLVPGLSFKGGIFNEQQIMFVPICPHGGERSMPQIRSGCTNLAFLGVRENAKNKLSVLSINTWGEQFSQPF